MTSESSPPAVSADKSLEVQECSDNVGTEQNDQFDANDRCTMNVKQTSSASGDAMDDALPASKSKRRTKRRRKRPPSVPKHPLNAYNFFFRDQRAKILAERESQGLSITGKELFSYMGREIAERWNRLKPDELAYYKNLGLKDLDRYREEMSRQRQVEVQQSSSSNGDKKFSPGALKRPLQTPVHHESESSNWALESSDGRDQEPLSTRRKPPQRHFDSLSASPGDRVRDERVVTTKPKHLRSESNFALEPRSHDSSMHSPIWQQLRHQQEQLLHRELMLASQGPYPNLLLLSHLVHQGHSGLRMERLLTQRLGFPFQQQLPSRHQNLQTLETLLRGNATTRSFANSSFTGNLSHFTHSRSGSMDHLLNARAAEARIAYASRDLATLRPPSGVGNSKDNNQTVASRNTSVLTEDSLHETSDRSEFEAKKSSIHPRKG